MVREITSSERKGFGGSLEGALKVKQKMLHLIEGIEKCKNEDLIELLREKVNSSDFLVLEQDIMTVLFFNSIYNKADDYFRILRSKISSALSKSLISIDSEITVLQEHQKHVNELKEKCLSL